MMTLATTPMNFQSTFAAKRTISHLSGFIRAQEALVRENSPQGTSYSFILPIAGDAMMTALLQSLVKNSDVDSIYALNFSDSHANTKRVVFSDSFLNSENPGLLVPGVDPSEWTFIAISYKKDGMVYNVSSYIK